MVLPPFFSIIIPTYNREKHIGRAIESVLNQVFQSWELIIVDDNSSDSTESIVKSFSDLRIRYIKNSINLERCKSRNIGIEVSNGKYICFLDSDDFFLSNHLEIFYKTIEKSKLDHALYFSNCFIMEDSDFNKKYKRIVPDIERFNVFTYLLKHTPNPARVCVSKSILEKEKFDPRLPGMEDLDLWLRIAVNYPIIHVKDSTSVYNVHKDSYTMGDEARFVKELVYLDIIHSKPELKKKIPNNAINRLKSWCHYNFAVQAYKNNNLKKFYNHAFKSIFLYPSGYNNKSTKDLIVLSIKGLV